MAEAKQRCAIGRAYYSVLIRARNLLRRNITVPREKTHSFVIDRYLNGRSKTQQDIGDNLNQLRTYRTRADYEDNLPQLGYFVALVLELADDTAKCLRKLP